MNTLYAVYFGTIPVQHYNTKEPAIYFEKEKAIAYAVEMNSVTIGGYRVEEVVLKNKKGKKK